MMGRTAEQTARMAELFEKKDLTPEESAEYSKLINILPGDNETTAKGLSTFQSIRLAELLRKKTLTQEEDTEYQNLLVVRNGGMPIKLKPKTKAAPWYLWLAGVLVYAFFTMIFASSFTPLGTIVFGLTVIYFIPDQYWKYHQRVKAEKSEQPHP